MLKKERNLEGSQVKNLSTANVVHYVLENKKAIKLERYTLSADEILPSVKIGLSLSV